MAILASFLLALIAAPRQAPPPRAGVMVTTGGRGVLAMAGPALGVGTTVTLVTIDSPQQVSKAVVGRRLADSDGMMAHGTPAPFYSVTPAPGTNALPEFAVAIVGRLEVERIGAAVALRIEKRPDRIQVRGCASSEGLHLTLWSGAPLKSTRLWHTYYYLGYDVEPTCQPGDLERGD